MIISKLSELIRGKGTRIVFTEGWDPRVMGAAVRLHNEDLCKPILLGDHSEVEACAKENGFDITGIEVLAPSEYPADDLEEMV
ncbi:MAG: phosphate acyltransferase, partial [Allobaculum sp.]